MLRTARVDKALLHVARVSNTSTAADHVMALIKFFILLSEKR